MIPDSPNSRFLLPGCYIKMRIMKKTASFLFVFISAWIVMSFVSAAQEVRRSFDVTSFHSVDSDIIGNVIFTQSDSSGVIAEGEEELVENLSVEVKDSRLILRDEKK